MAYPGAPSYVRGSLKSLSAEDAADYITDALRDQPQGVKDRGCDLWIPKLCMRFVQERVGAQMQTPDNDQATEEVSSSFLEGAWQLCRMGVLRPGRIDVSLIN